MSKKLTNNDRVALLSAMLHSQDLGALSITKLIGNAKEDEIPDEETDPLTLYMYRSATSDVNDTKAGIVNDLDYAINMLNKAKEAING